MEGQPIPSNPHWRYVPEYARSPSNPAKRAKWPPTPMDLNVPLRPDVEYKSSHLDPIWGQPVFFAPFCAGHRNQLWSNYPSLGGNARAAPVVGGNDDGNDGGRDGAAGQVNPLPLPANMGIVQPQLEAAIDEPKSPDANMTPPTTPKMKRSPASIAPVLLNSKCFCVI